MSLSQTTLNFNHAPKRANSHVIQPPPYEVDQTIDRYNGQKLTKLITKIADMRLHPIEFDEYLEKRLDDEQLTWYNTVMKLRFESEDEYPIDFDILWQMAGYSTKQKAKNMLIENFREKSDYSLLNQKVKQITVLGSGGHNIDKIFTTLHCAELFSVQARTQEGKKMANFFIKVTHITQEFMLINARINERLAGYQAVHNELVSRFEGKDCIYAARVAKHESGNSIVSMGHSNCCAKRTVALKKKYGEHLLFCVTPVHYKHKTEQAIFSHPSIACMMDKTILEGDKELLLVPENLVPTISQTVNQTQREIYNLEMDLETHQNASNAQRSFPLTREEVDLEKELMVLKEEYAIRLMQKTEEFKVREHKRKLEEWAIKSQPKKRTPTSRFNESIGELEVTDDTEFIRDAILGCDHLHEKTIILTDVMLELGTIRHELDVKQGPGDIAMISGQLMLEMLQDSVNLQVSRFVSEVYKIYKDIYGKPLAREARDPIQVWWEARVIHSNTHISSKRLRDDYVKWSKGESVSTCIFNKQLKKFIKVVKSVRTENEGTQVGLLNKTLRD